MSVELGGSPFKGFLIVAVDPLTGKRIGNWIKFKGRNERVLIKEKFDIFFLKIEMSGTDVLPCSAITHSNSKMKRLASLIWIPPAGQRGYVAFELVFFKTFFHFQDINKCILRRKLYY